jgi:hypothetical protein
MEDLVGRVSPGGLTAGAVHWHKITATFKVLQFISHERRFKSPLKCGDITQQVVWRNIIHNNINILELLMPSAENEMCSYLS